MRNSQIDFQDNRSLEYPEESIGRLIKAKYVGSQTVPVCTPSPPCRLRTLFADHDHRVPIVGVARRKRHVSTPVGHARTSKPLAATAIVWPRFALLPEVLRAQDILAQQFEIGSDMWSVTNYCQLRREAQAVARINALHPDQPKLRSYLEELLDGITGPFIAVTDYVKLVPDQIRQWIPGQYVTLGTDGFGRSDTRAALRHHFEMDAEHIAYATLLALSESSNFDAAKLSDAMRTLGIDASSMDPAVV